MGMGAFTRLSLRRKWRRRWAFFASDAELVAQERSSLMCSPRKLVLLTRSTAAPSMVSGGCSTFKALHYDGGQCHRAIVIEAGWSQFLWHRYDDGGLEIV